MAGKSNVIDLFRFIYDMIFPRQSGQWALMNAVVTRGGFEEIAWKGHGNENLIQIGLSGRDILDGVDWAWDYDVSLQGGLPGGNFRVSNESLRVRNATSPARTIHSLIQMEGVTRSFRDTNGREVSQMSDQQRSVLEFEIPSWQGNLLRSAITSWRFYELTPWAMRRPNAMAASLFLTEHGENLSQWLLYLQTRYGESFARIEAVLKDSLPQVTRLFTSPSQQSTVMLGSYEQHLSGPIMLSQMSSGELAFVAFLSLIFGPPELTGTLYCVEDLENYLHPKLIEIMLELLRQTQEEWERKKQAAQIVMTTHSPLVVDKTKLDEIVLVQRKEGATVCIRPTDGADLRQILQGGDLGLGDLVYSGALSDASR
jgi:predicted ATPase